jgi:Tol biopolymer transport system component/DNA-binding winged helix-turn-helix (wHTH) protein
MSLIYDFDDVRVDPTAFRVTKAGRTVPLEPKAFEVLVFLLDNPGRLVEKKELLERVWPDTVVTESAMTRVIADLRRALGDAAREARYIETVPTKGYRFIAEVRRSPGTAAPLVAAAPPRAARRRTAAWVAGGAAALAATAFFASHATRPGPSTIPATSPAAASSAKLAQVTDSLGLDMFPTFSPDGAQIAYCSDRDGPFEIYVRQLAPGGREIRITADGRGNFEPTWSPNGREIAYASRALPGLWVVPALGGEPRRLTTFGSRPAWSPDGATIVFQSLSIVEPPMSIAAPPSSLWTVPAAGGDPTPLTRVGMPVGGHGAPVFAPDGSEVVFAAWSAREELWSVSRKDGALRRILPPNGDPNARGSLQGVSDPAFSPRGDVLYFAASEEGYLSTGLWRMRKGEGGRWGEPERLSAGGPVSVRQIAVSTRTGALAYAALSIVSNVWSLPLDPKSSRPAGDASLLTRSAGGRNTAPRFSPDGSRIAYASCRAGAALDLWVMDRNGGGAHPVAASGSFPDWFPDGNRIEVFRSQRGRKELWQVSLEDRSQRLIFRLADDDLPAHLSHDGRSIAYSKGSAHGLETWVAPLDGGPPRRVTRAEVSAGWPAWSPDGRWLAVGLTRPTATLLAMIASGGGEAEVVDGDPGLSWPSDWSPDGGKILFAGLREGVWNVYWADRRGGAPIRLTKHDKARTFVRFPAWSPQGDRIVYEQAETTGNVWLVEPPP